MVLFLGPFELKAGKTAQHQVKIPPYVGSLRTMLVAAHQGAYGATETSTPVKQNLMLLATAPRVLGPEEEFSLPVNVFWSDSKSKTVKVKVAVQGPASLLGAAEQTVNFTGQGEKMVFFRLKTAQNLGQVKLHLEASAGADKASHDLAIDLRSPNPPLTQVQDQLLPPGQSLDWSYQPLGLPTTNGAMLEVSTMPAINLEQRLQYLVQYPHGCVEQTTSAAFPQLFLGDLMELSKDQSARIQQHLEAALNRLANFQRPGGGFSYWPGDNYISHWGTCYAGHFLLEAQAKGYHVAEPLMSAWLGFQQSQARSWQAQAQSYENNDLIQAYRLYTLARAGKAEMGAMNRMRELTTLSELARWRLALAYATAGQKAVAEELMAALSTEPGTEQTGYTYGSRWRDQAMIVETLVALGRQEEALTP
ncbi:MAG: hypothetical protein HC842_06195, partial [Cytophagales bacterium]|nr:hypothetical protein [Cytophagales bacterium]